MKLKRILFLGKPPSPTPGLPLIVRQVHTAPKTSLSLFIKWEYQDQLVSYPVKMQPDEAFSK